MYSVEAEIVKWEKQQNVPQALGGIVVSNDPKIDWDARRYNILTIRHKKKKESSGGDNVFELYPEPPLFGAFAKIDGHEICGVINSGRETDLYVCWFDSEVNFTVGSICTVTWDRYLEWGE